MLECYNDNQLACDSERGFIPNDVYLSMARVDSDELGCGDSNDTSVENVTTTTDDSPARSTAPPPNPLPCPSVPEIYAVNPAVVMSPADISPKAHYPECSMPRISPLRQCSLFMDSQLRAFNSYRGGLETCSLPGAWFLLHHQSISIGVEGTSLSPGYNHTRLTKINVTFHTHECNSVVRTYMAYNTEPLSSEFTPPWEDNSTSPLQLMLGEDGSVVTLMATWLNTTIIIRQYAEFLSITLQVPLEISLESEGLCTGCPSHLYLNITAINDQVPSFCPDDNERAIHNCFDHAGVANRRPLENVHNNSYLEACIFSMFKIKTSEVITMFNAIAGDAELLGNVGEPAGTPPVTFSIGMPTPWSQRPHSTSKGSELSATSDVIPSSVPPLTQSSPLTLITMAAASAVLSIYIFR